MSKSTLWMRHRDEPILKFGCKVERYYQLHEAQHATKSPKNVILAHNCKRHDKNGHLKCISDYKSVQIDAFQGNESFTLPVHFKLACIGFSNRWTNFLNILNFVIQLIDSFMLFLVQIVDFGMQILMH